jgi:glycosyltransferase involved in cell wall biosynthesis
MVPNAALVTIVSANYVPAARVLCRSFALHHPDVRRFVLIVDRPLSAAVSRDEPFETIDVADIGIPEVEDLLAQYTVLEANTAVKPYVLKYLFETHGFDRLVYLDPDIWVMSRLDAVWEALERRSIVLTPHLRSPYEDDRKPREIDILRSGTYNLGFVALRRGETASKLLDWWASKTKNDCVVDFASGLFVDQKWMDLVPGYFGDTELLHDPAYNAAYWNVHEREITCAGGRFHAASRPIAFFHFSGFDADHPALLSKHQDRHDLRNMPALRSLCAQYRELLLSEGHERAKRRPYAFARLRNGVPVSAVVRRAVRHLRKEGIAYPSVTEDDGDAFCRFLMTPSPEVTGRDLSPFSHFVLEIRKDVAAVYPRAVHDAEDPGFSNWLRSSGHEFDGEELVRRFGALLTRVDPFVRIERVYRRRPDLQVAFPDAFRALQGLAPFARWLHHHGIAEEGFTPEDVERFVDAGRCGFLKVLEHYLSTPELATAFPTALLPWANADFFDFILQNGRSAGISFTELCWFERRAEQTDPAVLLLLTAVRGARVRMQLPLGATVLGWKELCAWARADADARGVKAPDFPLEPPDRIPFASQLEALHAASAQRRGGEGAFRSLPGLRALADAVLSPLGGLLSDEARRRIDRDVAKYAPQRGVNLAGHFHPTAPAGVASLSLLRALDAAGIAHHDVPLPDGRGETNGRDDGHEPVPERFWTMHRPDFEVAITAVNADAMHAVRAYLGPCYDRSRTHIAYWGCNMTSLPGPQAIAAEGLDAIWTPSQFSARALASTLGDERPIHVVPYSVSVSPPIDPRTLPVALPEGRTLFGFFFDARSGVERKNPAAVVAAFRKAFRADDRVALVLKVNHGAFARKEMAALECLADGLPVVWLRDLRLDDVQLRVLLSRLDVYVSLHRSEGFGTLLAEAMSLSKPVLATAYSGNLEFMDETSASLVRCREITTERSHGPYPPGTRWADVDVEHAAAAMRVLHHDADLRRDLGHRAHLRVERTLSPWVVGKRVATLLGFAPAAAAEPALGPNVHPLLRRLEETAASAAERSRELPESASELVHAAEGLWSAE